MTQKNLLRVFPDLPYENLAPVILTAAGSALELSGLLTMVDYPMFRRCCILIRCAPDGVVQHFRANSMPTPATAAQYAGGGHETPSLRPGMTLLAVAASRLPN